MPPILPVNHSITEREHKEEREDKGEERREGEGRRVKGRVKGGVPFPK
jgi:hypothetical protein